MEVVLKAVQKLISEQIEEIKTARGNMSLYPKSIMELVFSEVIIFYLVIITVGTLKLLI